MPENPTATERKRQAVEQFRALSRMSYHLSEGDENGAVDGDSLYTATEAVTRAMASDLEKPDAKPEAIAATAEALGTILRFAGESPEYRSNGSTELDASQREGFKSCASMAGIAASLCREAAGAQ